jgi:hypothetical protein
MWWIPFVSILEYSGALDVYSRKPSIEGVTREGRFKMRFISKRVGKIIRGQGVRDSGEMLKNYRELKARQRSYRLCLEIYKITKRFPNEERYGLASQIRRAALCVSSNIAEGYSVFCI